MNNHVYYSIRREYKLIKFEITLWLKNKGFSQYERRHGMSINSTKLVNNATCHADTKPLVQQHRLYKRFAQLQKILSKKP